MSTPVVVSIGTTHPWNIAGVGLDAQIACEFGVRSATVIAGISAQDESGMREKFAVPTRILRAQLDSLPRDQVGAFRIGALFEEENVREVAGFLLKRRGTPVVVDPVFDASLGGTFASEATFHAFRTNILNNPVILTPNIPEAQRLTGREITNKDDMVSAAHALRSMGAKAVLIKGGHLSTPEIFDVLVTQDQTRVYRDLRLNGSMRGTGCTLAMGIACELARGRTLTEAVERAREYVRQKISAQITYGTLQVAF